MSEKEAIEHIKKLKEGILYLNTISSVPDNIDIEAIDTILQTLKNKDKRIDELEKALVDEQLKYTDKIKQLNDKMIADKMEQFDDYIIYLIESYLDIMEE